jgi:hypothetical protein
VEGKWRSELPDRTVFAHGWRFSRRWDWWLIGWWLVGLSSCVAFLVLLGLTLSGIDY